MLAYLLDKWGKVWRHPFGARMVLKPLCKYLQSKVNIIVLLLEYTEDILLLCHQPDIKVETMNLLLNPFLVIVVAEEGNSFWINWGE